MAPDMIEDAVKFAAGGAGMGGGAIGIMFLLRWFITFMAGRADIKEDRLIAQAVQLDARWKEYRETLETRLGALEAEVERCHDEKRNLEHRIAKMEGFATGRGEAVQIGQIDQSVERVFKDKERGQ